jgi:hypothetical protein
LIFHVFAYLAITPNTAQRISRNIDSLIQIDRNKSGILTVLIFEWIFLTIFIGVFKGGQD